MAAWLVFRVPNDEMKTRTPQEKKELSYERDRRNRFGQSDKATRRIIPLKKSKANRAVRRAAGGITKVSLGDFDNDSAAKMEAKAAKVSLARWRKAPDSKLKDAIQAKKE